MADGEYLQTRREAGLIAEQETDYSARPPKLSDRWGPKHPPMPNGIVMTDLRPTRINRLNYISTLPQPADISLVMADPIYVSKVVYMAINAGSWFLNGSI